MLSLSFSSEWSLITGIKADEAGGFVRGRHSRERVKQKRRAFQKEPANRFSLFSPPFSAVRGSSVTTVWLFPTQPDKLLTARPETSPPFLSRGIRIHSSVSPNHQTLARNYEGVGGRDINARDRNLSRGGNATTWIPIYFESKYRQVFGDFSLLKKKYLYIYICIYIYIYIWYIRINRYISLKKRNRKWYG